MSFSKGLTKTILLLGLGMITNLTISNSAIAEVKIREDCRYDQCWELYFIKKTKIKKTKLGQLYSVSLKQRDPKTGKLLWAYNQQIFCSPSRPAVVSKEKGLLYVNFINLGIYPPSIKLDNYAVYWKTCHNVIGIDSSEQARKLGYQLNYYEQDDQIMKNINQLIYP